MAKISKSKSISPTKNKEEVTKPKELNPFDFIKSIQVSKTHLINESDDPEYTAKLYNAWLTNKALSFHIDSILHANEVNRMASLDNIMQYDYYINSIRSMKRNHIWLKKSTDEDLDFICEVYKMNRKRASELLAIIGHEKVEELKKVMIKGGNITKR